MNIKEAIMKASSQVSISDARMLLSKALGKSREYILMYPDHDLSKAEEGLFFSFIQRRKNHEPISYITENTEFYSRDFKVNKHVLIPRPDTEILVEEVIKRCHQKDPNILDLGTGSGAIAVTLALEISGSYITAVDVSPEAIEVAKFNAKSHKVNDRIEFILSNWYDKLDPNNLFDIIVSNPPYIARSETPLMSKETILYEPETALYAEKEGLLNYEIITEKAGFYLRKGGMIFLEIGFAQKHSVEAILENNGFKEIETILDLSGNDRVVVGKWI